MLDLKNVDKYYGNLHVLKDVSLSLEDNGLISIVGESGCGKTTLLHTIGGLDSYAGTITYNGKTYKGLALDLYRQDNIGFIFQNYLLFEELTVYENLAICLRTIGIKDKEEVDKRISYVLKQVGMFKQRKKLAKNLSGGQMQRVSIARALVKNTKIILADEPTGNLDRRNSIEIMNILKRLSKTTLVLLVTHNKELASVYSDRIIQMVDGNVLDNNTNLDYNKVDYLDDVIYLEDYDKKDLSNDDVSLSLYGDVSKLELKIILRGKNLYLVSNKKLQIINPNNVKEKREQLAIYDDNTNYDTSFFVDNKKSGTLLTWKEAFINFFNLRRKRDFFMKIAFLFLGVLFAVVTFLFFNSMHIDTSEFVFLDGKSLLVYHNYDSERIDYNDISPYIENYFGYAKTYVKVDNDNTYAEGKSNYESITLLSSLNTSKIIVGDNSGLCLTTTLAKNIFSTTNYKEIVGEKLIVFANSNYEKSYKITGIVKDNGKACFVPDYDLIKYITLSKNNYDSGIANYVYYGDFEGGIVSEEIAGSNDTIKAYALANSKYVVGSIIKNNNVEIVGKVSLDDLRGYDESTLFILDEDKVRTLNTVRDTNRNFQGIEYTDFNLVEGRLPESPKECLAPVNYFYNVGSLFNDIKVVGLYEGNYNETHNSILMYTNDIIINIVRPYYLQFDVIDFDGLNNYLINNELTSEVSVVNAYDNLIRINEEDRQEDLISLGAVLGVLAVVYVSFVFLIMRSQILKEQRDIAIYRSLGATKKSFYAKYIKNIIMLSLFTSTLGYILVYLFMFTLNSLVKDIIAFEFYYLNFLSFFSGLIIIYVINIVIGILPILLYLRNSPAKLVSKYDM